jgi:hypothetical protein
MFNLPIHLLINKSSSCCLLSIKYNSNLLERSATGLEEEKVYNDNLDGDPDIVVDIEFPAGVFEADGLVELVYEFGDGGLEDVLKLTYWLKNAEMKTDSRVSAHMRALHLYGATSTGYDTTWNMVSICCES